MRGILLLVGRLERERAEAEQNKYDPVATLDLLAVRAPLIAAVLAVQYGLPWPARVTRHAAGISVAATMLRPLKRGERDAIVEAAGRYERFVGVPISLSVT